MAKQLNVNLNFTADASQAKQVLNDLSANLTQISSITPISGTKLSKDLEIAKRSAQDLQQHMINAFNVKTGNLDLNKLNTSLKQSGQSLGQLSSNLLKAGQSGEQAFMNIQRSISNASVQITQANGVLNQFYTTLMNTARWQLTSSLLHGMMSSVRSAWSYAKNLDESLNNIRIVTGYSAEKMSDFAKQANSAAKALSTTTTEYTKASLIFYQQGLNDSEVQKRTEATIKMSQVTGQSAETVSDQLTAVWNNFYDGTKSLEYYVDVMTALGAATASSTDEISQGLEKFAAVAETVGLSYEYATSALATVTATTRQSADVVGTAFKTLFARLNDLKLGETLEDGTTLGTYTENLAKVGISIKDAAGGMKDMDQILEETASKWKILDRDQQIALAKGVAGIRQYSQFIALMDNWDFMEKNLETAKNSGGTLSKQAEIFEDSWKAATNRVKAAAEDIYTDLFPTDKMTGMMDGFAVVLNGIDGLVQGLGGLQGILGLIATVVMNVFSKQIGGAIDSVIGKVSSISAIGNTITRAFTGGVSATKQLSSNLTEINANSGNAAKQIEFFEQHLERGASLAAKNSYEMGKSAEKAQGLSSAFQNYNANLMQVNNIQATIEQSNKYLTTQQKEQLSILQQQALAANEQVLEAENLYKIEKERSALRVTTAGSDVSNLDRFRIDDNNGGKVAFDSSLMNSGNREQDVQKISAVWNEVNGAQNSAIEKISTYKNHISLVLSDTGDLVKVNKDSQQSYSKIYEATLKIKNINSQGKVDEKEREKAIRKVAQALKEEDKLVGSRLKSLNVEKASVKDIERALNKAQGEMKNFAIATGSSEKDIKGIEAGIISTANAEEKAVQSAENFKNKMAQVTTTLKNGLAGAMSIGNIMSSMAGGFSSIAMGINSISNAFKTLKDENADFSTKLTSGAMAATMGIGALMTVMKGLGSVINSVNAYKDIQNAKEMISIALQEKENGNLTEQMALEKAKQIMDKLGLKQDDEEIQKGIAKKLIDESDIKTTEKSIITDYAKVASQAAKLWYITLIVAAIAALIAITVMLINKESEEEKQLKKSTEAAEAAAEEYDRVKQKAEAIKDAFDGYKTVIDKLNACKKGTKEWREALEEVSSTTQKIMTDYPELVNKYSDLFYRDSETGTLMMDSDTMDQVIKDQNAAVNAASLNKSFSLARVQKDKAAVDIDNDFGAQKDLDYVGKSALKNLTENELLELEGLSGSELSNKILELTGLSLKDMAIGYYSESAGEKIVTDKAMKDAEKALQSLDDSLEDYSESVNGASKQMQTAAELMMDQQIPEESAEVKVVAAAQTVQNEDKYYDAYLGLMTDIADSSGKNAKLLGITQKQYDLGISKTSSSEKDSNFAYDKILEDLQKYVDAGFGRWTDNGIQGDDDNRYLVFSDSEGKEWKKSADYIAKQLSSARVLAEINDSVNTSKDLLNNMEKNIAKINNKNNNDAEMEGMNTFIGYKNFDSLSVNNFKELYAAVRDIQGDTGEGSSVSKADAGWYLDKLIGQGDDGKISKDNAAQYGFSSGEEMVNAFYNALTNGKSMFGNVDFSEIIGFDKLSLQAASAMEDTFNRIKLGPSGELAAQQFITGFNKMLEGIDETKRTEAMEKLATIDWTSADALSQASAVMATYGKTIDTSTEYWLNFAEAMKKASLATPDFSKIKEDLTAINKIIKELDFGSTISEEDYEILKKNNGAWADLFILQSDGTRKFIGNEKEMQQVTRARLKEYQKELKKSKETADSIINSVDGDKNKILFTDEEIEQNADGDGKDGRFNFASNETAKYLLERMGKGYSVDSSGKVWRDKDGDGKVDYEVSNEDASKYVMAASQGEMVANYVNPNRDTYNEEIHNALLNQGWSQAEIDNAIGQAMYGNNEKLEKMWSGIENLVSPDYDTMNSEYQEMLASTATSSIDFDKISNKESFDTDTKQKGLKNLASAYADCADEVEAYNDAIQNGTPEEQAKAEKELRKSLRDAEWRKATKAINGYYKEMKNLTEAEDIAEKQKEMADSLNELFGTNIGLSFIKENWALMEAWMNATGDRATELALQIQAKAVMASAKASEIVNDTVNSMGVDVDKDGEIEIFIGRWEAMKAMIEANPITINADGKANLTQLITSLLDAGFTAQEVANYLASIGQTKVEISGYGDAIEAPPTDVTSSEWATWWTNNFSNLDANIKVTSAEVPSRGIADMSTIKEGSGSKPKKARKSDVVKRYKEVDDKLDQNTKEREKLEAMTDTLTGQARLDNINAIIEKRKEENKLLEEKYKLAKLYAEEDQKELDRAASEAGVKFEYNKDGTIKNYTEVMTSLYNKYNADNNIDEKEQEKLDKITEAMDAYEESLEVQDELEQRHLDNQLANQQDNLDGINEFYDKKQSFLDSDNEYLEYYIAKYEKDFSKHIKDISNLYSEQGANIATSLGNLQEKQEELRKAYENGDINLKQFQEASQQSQSDIIAQLQAYDDLTESMNELYGSAMEEAREEIDLYTSQQEHLNSVLDHYSSILDIVGKEQDYAAKRNILTSKANNINNELKTQTALYKQYSADAIYWEEEMNKAKQEKRELDYERYKTYWQNAQEAANEAQENMLSKTEEWAEAMRAVVENELAELGKTLEKSLTGEFGNFENLTTSMERANSLQEEYLTTTNKIYETNKMMRTAQQEIDKTTNTAAKNRLKQFINETEQLQNQTKLSQYELDIQQAKYDLLLAEIALEEAQNAKSTVRLQRDAEGNMGYVYTADSSKVAEAEQQLADAQNALYNKGLEGANDYNQKYAETMSEMYDTLKELQTQYLDGAFATEQEYQDAMAAAKEYYYEKLEQYSSLYTVAIGTDARVVSDAWSTQFSDMMYKTEDWKIAVEEYSTGVATHLSEWSKTVKTTLENSGLNDTEKAVKGINDESKNLAKTLLGEGENDKGLVGALEKTSKQVQDQQTQFENLASDIDEATKKYDKYLELVRQDINANEDHTKIDKIDNGNSDNNNNNNNDNNSTNSNSHTYTVQPGDSLWAIGQRFGVPWTEIRAKNGIGNNNLIHPGQVLKFDTGGYTGDWGGPDGKLAMLHKKELILEPGDTQNFLMGMEVLERIVSAIDLYSMNAQLGGLLNTPYYSGSNSPETLEQNVHIEASFPGVSDRNELEEAFNNLINQASQYANRK